MTTCVSATGKLSDARFEIRDLAEDIVLLREAAYVQYEPRALELCSRNASEHEVEWFLDGVLDFVESEKALHLYKQVCRRFAGTYPRLVSEHVKLCMKRLDLEEDGEE